jgi:hypothetical protein
MNQPIKMSDKSETKLFLIKVAAVVLIIIVIANMALFALGKITPKTFWMLIVLFAFLAWFAFPKTTGD